MSKVGEMVAMFRQMAKQQQVIGTVWATAKEIDWENKTMIATGLKDDLDYFNVRLGLGAIVVKPKVGARCLLGIIENKEAEAHLLSAEAFDEIHYGSAEWSSVKGESLVEESNKDKVVLDTIINAFSAFVPPPSPDGGVAATAFLSALKTALSTQSSGNYTDILNKKIKHGE
ncbi:MAG: hypothetical protein M9892_04640 [Bacteroidetes bacterium]|nr:hypothetical protein [Bacteroidota bacterium]